VISGHLSASVDTDPDLSARGEALPEFILLRTGCAAVNPGLPGLPRLGLGQTLALLELTTINSAQPRLVYRQPSGYCFGTVEVNSCEAVSNSG